ncbi:MAG: dihydropteroate synthase [Anaerolineales bacterium]|jgi:dihydropteroate synthase
MVLDSQKLQIGEKIFNWGSRTYTMGILNITPDSFSGDGLLSSTASSFESTIPSPEDRIETAILLARKFVELGVDIIDVGGESTRPGSEQVNISEELERVLPVISAIKNVLNIPVSIDTYKSEVASEALRSGADMVNDVWGLKADKNLAGVIAGFNAPVIMMHNRSSWAHADIQENLGGRYIGLEYQNLIEDIKRELQESISIASNAGIPKELIIIDPGIGFGKTVEQNLELINNLDKIRDLGFPVLFGPSRKSFIGYTLNLPPDQRVEGTAAAVAIGIDRGADIIRIHDVEYMMRVARMSDAIVRSKIS